MPVRRGSHAPAEGVASYPRPIDLLRRCATMTIGREVRDPAGPEGYMLTFAAVLLALGWPLLLCRHVSLQGQHQPPPAAMPPVLAQADPLPDTQTKLAVADRYRQRTAHE